MPDVEKIAAALESLAMRLDQSLAVVRTKTGDSVAIRLTDLRLAALGVRVVLSDGHSVRTFWLPWEILKAAVDPGELVEEKLAVELEHLKRDVEGRGGL